MTAAAQEEILINQIRQRQGATRAVRTSRISKMGQPSSPLSSRALEIMFARAREEERRREQTDAEEKRQAIISAWNKSGVGRRFLSSRLDNYKADTPEHAAALAVCREVAEGFGRGAGVLLLGEPEGGKTHLLCGTASRSNRSQHDRPPHHRGGLLSRPAGADERGAFRKRLHRQVRLPGRAGVGRPVLRGGGEVGTRRAISIACFGCSLTGVTATPKPPSPAPTSRSRSSRKCWMSVPAGG